MAGPVTYGTIDLNKDPNDNGIGYSDIAKFEFAKILSYNPGSQPFFLSWIDTPPISTCVVYNNTDGSTNAPVTGATNLNPGSSFTVKGPNGSVPVAASPGSSKTTLSAAGTFLVPGMTTISGNGGPDVGPINASITIPAPPTLVSPTNSANFKVTRAQGLTVTWSGGDPTGYVQIDLTSAIDQGFTIGATANCIVPASAGTFTVPPYVLLKLPSSNFSAFQFGSSAAPVAFTATGLDVGFVSYYDGRTGFNGFQVQ
jgi:hypothetical protein